MAFSPGVVNSPRVWNGTVYYSAVGDLGRVYVVYGAGDGLGDNNNVYDKCSNISGDCWGDSEFGSALASIPSPNYLFADGFEREGTGRWSVTSP